MSQPTPPASDPASPVDHAEEAHHLEQQRRINREKIAGLGVDPYGGRTDGLVTLAEARAAYDAQAEAAYNDAVEAAKASAESPGEPVADARPVVRVAGRVVLKRSGGKLIWLQLRDHTTGPAQLVSPETKDEGGAEGEGDDAPAPSHLAAGLQPDLQVAVSKKDAGSPSFDVARELDLGDIVIAEGPLMKTRTGEVTVWASSLTMAAKSLAPPPEKWAGLQDVETRYRRRYQDLYANPESMRVFRLRSEIVFFLRRWLVERGFVEVETPMLQVQAGGAAARPFSTHMNALDIDLYMRIAPELYLKRLMVGGMPKVFEINRNFRNEGLDKQHNPEFTMLELYDAHGDVERVMENTENLIRAAARMVAESFGLPEARLPFTDYTVDYESPFDRVTYAELFERALGFSMTDRERVSQEAAARKLRTRGEDGTPVDHVFLVNELFEEYAEKSIDPGKPTFITRYPSALSPLTRPNRDDPDVADRADLFIGHMEIGPHYTELNDPDVQAAKFKEQLGGTDDEETTFRTFDADFIQALKVGMPPAGGMGLGIDRLCMLLLNQRTIRDVVLFPMMRPEG